MALTENGAIVGKRAEARSAKRCQDVLCAYRQMLFAMEEVWSARRKACEEGWQFSVFTDEDAARGAGVESSFYVRGEQVPVSTVIGQVFRVVLQHLLDAAQPGGPLQVRDKTETPPLCCALLRRAAHRTSRLH